jgi:hypothetical protein
MPPAGQNSPGIDGGRPAMPPEMDRQSVRFRRLSSLLILPRVDSFFEVGILEKSVCVAAFTPYCSGKIKKNLNYAGYRCHNYWWRGYDKI